VLAGGLLLAGATLSAQRAGLPAPVQLPPEVLELACAPKAAFDAPPTPLRITGGQDANIRYTHGSGDIVTINAGSQNGIQVGQEYYTRRVLVSRAESVTKATPITVVTSGWIRVWAVDDTMSLATIVHSCESIEIDDHLEPFVLPTAPTVSSSKPKAERDYGKVLTGKDRRRVFGKGDFFILDRGKDHGIEPGSQFVVYRNKHQPENFLYELGEAVAVEVTESKSTLKITMFRDAILEGDLVALRRPTPQTP
jgi:hypothetical protein